MDTNNILQEPMVEKPQEEKFIEIEKVIAEKNPRLAKALPGFIISYIKKVLHQDQINTFITAHGHLYNFDFIEKIIKEFGVEIETIGMENVPEKGGIVIASNHPLGGLDALSMMHMIGKKRKDMRFIVNDILLSFKNLKELFIPVNKHGKSGAESVKMINAQFASDELTLVFPAGLVSRKQEGIIKDLDWKKSFITKARQYQRDIIPVYVEGKNSSFFYNLSLWRKRLGIKANIEMFYLMDEMYKQRGKKITIYFGKPIKYSTFDKSNTDEQWANILKGLVYSLPKQHLHRLTEKK
jgi:putative hemolysin